MKFPLLNFRRSQAISTAICFIGLAIVAYLDSWWPGIMLVIGISLASKQFLMGRFYDTGISLLVFIGTFVTVYYNIPWEILLPVLFSLAAIYVLIREFTEYRN